MPDNKTVGKSNESVLLLRRTEGIFRARQWDGKEDVKRSAAYEQLAAAEDKPLMSLGCLSVAYTACLHIGTPDRKSGLLSLTLKDQDSGLEIILSSGGRAGSYTVAVDLNGRNRMYADINDGHVTFSGQTYREWENGIDWQVPLMELGRRLWDPAYDITAHDDLKEWMWLHTLPENHVEGKLRDDVALHYEKVQNAVKRELKDPKRS